MTSAIDDELEIGCDESGYEGDRLVRDAPASAHPTTVSDVFAHASVALPVDTAAECIRELRDRIRSPVEEYKAGHLLRQKHRDVLTWFLHPGSLVRGQVLVYLVDKEYRLLRALGETLLDDATVADALYPHRRDGTAWHDLLVAANVLLRSRGRIDADRAVARFFDALAALRPKAPVEVTATLTRFEGTQDRAEWFSHQPPDDRLDPLTLALSTAAKHWRTQTGRPVVLLQDRTNTLTPERLERLAATTGTRVRLVDSLEDARVQVADIVGGAIRKIAQNELRGLGDPELVALVPGFVSGQSLWGDAGSRPLVIGPGS